VLSIYDPLPSSIDPWSGAIGAIFMVAFLILICLRDRRNRFGPTRREIGIIISIWILFLIPVIVAGLMWYGGLIGFDSPILVIPIFFFVGTIYTLFLIIAYGTKK